MKPERLIEFPIIIILILVVPKILKFEMMLMYPQFEEVTLLVKLYKIMIGLLSYLDKE